MRSFTVYVPDDKVPFFIELVNRLRFKVKESTGPVIDLSPEHKKILDQRLENYNNHPLSYKDWEDVQKDIEKML